MSEEEQQHGFFETLEQHAQILSPPVELGLRRDRYLLSAIVVGLALAWLPWARYLGASVAPWLQILGLVLQLSGLSVLAYRQIKDTVPDFVDAKRKFSIEMDRHFADRETVIAWLRTVPEADRRDRLRYVEARLETIKPRYSLIFGAIDKLGFLPVLVGAFLQIQAMQSLSPLSTFFGGMIIGMYAMSLWLMRYQLQLEGYARLMRAASEPQ